ncbi:MAG: DUF1553 domain-containing protein [Planctomycetaceae bacterium]|nr:DUF1553 domain-containing protein [Planctomycetaceae bacterium]
MQPADPALIDAEALIATGMLAIADFVPGDVDKQQMIADYVNDQIDVVGRAVLGLTLVCARCHDHKFDPITTDDYYSLAGIFFSTRLVPGPVPGNTPLVRVPLLPAAELQAIAASAERDKQRVSQLSQELAVVVDREYLAALERQVTTQSKRDLTAALEFIAAAGDPNRPEPAAFAVDRKLDAAMLQRWIALLEQPEPPAALRPLLAAADADLRDGQLDELQVQLASIAGRRRTNATSDSVAQFLAKNEILQFRADDRRIAANETGSVTRWPDRAAIPDDAVPVANAPGPVMATALIGGHQRRVVRFQGESVLQAPRSVPPVGSFLAVFRPDQAAPAGGRLIGWEDSATGQHGLGLMPDAAGGLHAILRRAGASGDVVVSAPATPEFQRITLTWGADGVALFRNGEPVGTNKGIDAVSSDPTIRALTIGGPGSGGSPRFRGDLSELRVYSAPLDEAARMRVEAELRRRWFDAPGESTDAIDPASDLYDELFSSRSPYWVAEAERLARLSPEVRERLTAWRDELESLQKKPAAEIPRAVVVQEGGPPGTKHEGFNDAQVYIRGNPANPGRTVPRGFPHALAGADQPPIQEGSGRRELVRWLTRADHPLTARVMVNRIWQHHFGEGLVRTSTNFGVRGELPSHPELLDYLAQRFIASGWSVKAMHRLIVLSSVYQQSTNSTPAALAADPENRRLARMPRRRLEAEAIRDSLLAVSGRLDPTPGGPGFLEAAVPRRTLYLMSVRTGSKTADFNSLFDGPDGGGIIERRNQSIVAPQALYLLNDALLDEVSAGLAARVAREVDSVRDDDRIRGLYDIAFGRPPTAAEIEIGLKLVADSEKGADSAAGEGWTRYCRVILCTNEFVYVD